jgi:hypothetical protein
MEKIEIAFYNNVFNGLWLLGIGDWGLGIGPNPQSPIPNPQERFITIQLFIFINCYKCFDLSYKYIINF